MKLFYSLIFLSIVLLNSCAPSREEALEYYEKMLQITHPVEKGALEITSVVYIYTDEHFKGSQKIEALQVEAIGKMNENLLKKIQESNEKLANLPSANYGLKLRTAAQNYLNGIENNQTLIANSILSQLTKESTEDQKKKTLEAVDYVIDQHRILNLEFIEAMILFEKENNLYDFDRKDIEKKIDGIK